MVAVAANFRDASAEIGREFRELTGHTAIFSYGSTGQLFAQILQGAPFEVFLSADRERAGKAVIAGVGVEGSRLTYAVGRLAVVSRPGGVTPGPEALRTGAFDRLAVAEPRSAPYGQAAIEVLRSLGLLDRLSARLVRGQNVAQAHQFVLSGNADLGFVALAQVKNRPGATYWLVPEDLHSPIRQDAVLLKAGAPNPAARAFLEFLSGPRAAVIQGRYGYGSFP